MTGYYLVWETIGGNFPNKPRKGQRVTTKTYPTLDKARKAACFHGGPYRFGGWGNDFIIKIFDDTSGKFVGDVYGSWSYTYSAHDGIMWCPPGTHDEDRVHGISVSTGKLNKTLYRLT